MNNTYKKLEELYAWKEFAQNGDVPNVDEIRNIDEQIKDYKKKHNIR